MTTLPTLIAAFVRLHIDNGTPGALKVTWDTTVGAVPVKVTCVDLSVQNGATVGEVVVDDSSNTTTFANLAENTEHMCTVSILSMPEVSTEGVKLTGITTIYPSTNEDVFIQSISDEKYLTYDSRQYENGPYQLRFKDYGQPVRFVKSGENTFRIKLLHINGYVGLRNNVFEVQASGQQDPARNIECNWQGQPGFCNISIAGRYMYGFPLNSLLQGISGPWRLRSAATGNPLHAILPKIAVVRDFRTGDVTESSVELLWDYYPNSASNKCTVSWKNQRTGQVTSEPANSWAPATKVISGLEPGTDYEFSITRSNTYTTSAPSIVSATTRGQSI